VLGHAVAQGGRHGLGVDRFEQHPEHPALVHGDRGVGEAGVAGEQHARTGGGRLRRRGQELGPVDAGHQEVGHDHRERVVRLEGEQAVRGADGGLDGEVAAQLPPEAVEEVGLVVDQQDPGSFDRRRHAGSLLVR
jgi:hypothetical protein